jgi:hypothetical protein
MLLRNGTCVKRQNIVTIKASCAGPKLLQFANLFICNLWLGVIQNLALPVFNALNPSGCNIKSTALCLQSVFVGSVCLLEKCLSFRYAA